MKKLMGNSVVCVGSFSGPDIEEGTFHNSDVIHKRTAQRCPCPPSEFDGTEAPDDPTEDNEKDTNNND